MGAANSAYYEGGSAYNPRNACGPDVQGLVGSI
jgi:hypothetical protein